MRVRALLPCLLLVASGCVAPEGADEGDAPATRTDWAALALPTGEGHDHADPLQHQNGTTPNLRTVGRDPMVSAHYGRNAGGNLCADARETLDGRRLAVVESRSDVGFSIVDATDPAAPRWLGELVMEDTYVYDLSLLPSGDFAVLVTHAARTDLPPLPPLPPLPAEAPPELTWRTPCGEAPVAWRAEDPLPREASALLVDLRDPAEPAVLQQLPLTGYGHSAFSTRIDGRDLVLAVTLGPQTERSAAHLLEFVAAPAPHLEVLSLYRSDPGEGAERLQGAVWHDGWIAEHPVTGQTLMHLVGGHRYEVLDLADPREPEPVAAWSDDDPGAGVWTGNLHSVLPMPDVWDGHHYTLIGPEFHHHPEDHPSGIVRMLDTTDPAAPREVGAWTLPVDVAWPESEWYLFSNHYFAVWDRTLLVSMYHGGVWAVDLRPAVGAGQGEFVHLPSVGVYQPLDATMGPAAHPVRWAPTTQEVFAFDDGTLLTFDSNTGAYTFRLDADRPAPAPTPWPLAPALPGTL